MDALPPRHDRRQEPDPSATVVCEDIGEDPVGILRGDREIAVGTVLDAEAGEEEERALLDRGGEGAAVDEVADPGEVASMGVGLGVDPTMSSARDRLAAVGVGLGIGATMPPTRDRPIAVVMRVRAVGATALAVMPNCPSSAACVIVRAAMPALAAA